MTDSGQDYQALYRRFRPQRFGDVVGQEHVSTALRNAVRDGRVAHAYMFSGPRGTGKTTSARILAKALNCETPQEGEPCDACQSCVDIARGASISVVELDAASNRGIEDVRRLIEQVGMTTGNNWRVFIIDEVHQLTGPAEAALLKTLEEPPPRVVFALATTDPQKVGEAIRSRTQQYQLRLLSEEQLLALLSEVNDEANLGIDDAGLRTVARRGRGSARDALSFLDQIAASGTLTDDTELVSDIVEAVCQKNAPEAVAAVQRAVASGTDLRVLCEDLISYLRDVLLLPMAPSSVTGSPARLEAVRSHAQRLGPAGATRAIDMIGSAMSDMRDAIEPRIPLEVAIIRLAAASTDPSMPAILERLERLEAGQGTVGSTAVAPSAAGSRVPPSSSPKSSEPPDATRAVIEAPEEVVPELAPQPEPVEEPTAPQKPSLGALLQRPEAPQRNAPAETSTPEEPTAQLPQEPEPRTEHRAAQRHRNDDLVLSVFPGSERV